LYGNQAIVQLQYISYNDIAFQPISVIEQEKGERKGNNSLPAAMGKYTGTDTDSNREETRLTNNIASCMQLCIYAQGAKREPQTSYNAGQGWSDAM
jgi:hypothetical protein